VRLVNFKFAWPLPNYKNKDTFDHIEVKGGKKWQKSGLSFQAVTGRLYSARVWESQ
jgi:hypothetical protein